MEEVIIIPVIVALVYGIIALYKEFVKKEKYIRLIPIISAAIGAALGVIAFYVTPEIMPASDVLSALLFGGASGLAATGTNQIYKQLTKKDSSNDDSTNG